MGDTFFRVLYFPVTCGTSYEDERLYKLPCAMFFCNISFLFGKALFGVLRVPDFRKALRANVDMFLKWAGKTRQLSDVQLVVEYLRDKAKRLEENADYIEKHMEEIR